MSSITALQLIDRARTRHPAFGGIPEGSLVGFVDDAQRTLLLQYGGDIDGLVSTTVQLATAVSGVVVGTDDGTSTGTPIYGTTYADGWPVHQTAAGVPYVDFSEPAVAGDPFGEHGGVPGFPFPTDFLKLIHTVAVYTDNRVGPVDVLAENQRLERPRAGIPTAFISGNRMVPARPLSTGNTGDPWAASIAAIQLTYIARPVVAALTDTITLPAVLIDALTAVIAAHMAQFADGMSESERQRFANRAEQTLASLQTIATDITGAASTTRVAYRR